MKSFFLVLWLCLHTLMTQAALLTPDSREVNLLASAQFLEDPDGRLRLEDVQGMGERFRPWTGGGTELNFGFTSSTYWVRVPLQRMATAPADWLLEVHYAKLQNLDFFPPEGPPVRTGMARPLSTQPYFDRNFVFPIRVGEDVQYVYLRAHSRYALTVPLTVWMPDHFRQRQQLFQVLQFMYYGGLVVLGMYGLVIFYAVQDRRFLIYAAYIATAGLGIFASNGFGRQLLWPSLAAFDEVSQSIFLSLAAYFAMLFARRMLLPVDDRSTLHRGMQVSGWLFLLTAALDLVHMAVPVLLRPSNQLLMLNSMAMGLLVSLASWRAWKAQRSGVRFFIMGWLVLWLGVTAAAMRAFGVLPSNGFTSYAVQLSTAFEMVLMALALGDLLRLEHRAYMATQAMALESNRQLLELSQASEEKLRKAVLDRTAQLENSLKLEKQLREQYVRFGSMISHEFRTPLNIIQSQASLIRKEREQGIDQLGKRLEAIRSASQRLTTMFDKWLQNDALNETLEVMEFRPLDLQPWLRTLVQTNPHLLLNHGLDLRLSPAVASVVADEYHLGLALTNLLDNAAKYSPENSTITIETCLKPGFAGIAVSDQGPGIPPDVQDKVFAEFFRFAPESHVRGVGLGLSIVKRIAEAHDGHVTLTSAPGHGATFCIWLPLNRPKDAA